MTFNYWLASSKHFGTSQPSRPRLSLVRIVDYNVVIEGDRERDPLHFAEIDAENDALHRNQPITTTMCHRQCGVNLLWWRGSRGGSANPRDYNAIISVLRFLPR